MEHVAVFENVSFSYPDSDRPVFNELSLTVSTGVTSLVGQNGTGKSTFMLLASSRLLPDEGTVKLFDRNTKEIEDEEEKNSLASFVYQNMEFETEDPLGELLGYVFENGFLKHRQGMAGSSFLSDITKAFELEKILDRKTQNMSKGELQRAILAFSMAYGSRSVMMDEPVFAMEQRQKEKALEFIASYSRETGTPVMVSLHELALTEKYSDNVIFVYKDGHIKTGRTEELLTRENLEEVYQAPYGLLHSNEAMHRENLVSFAEAVRKSRA